jgi:hypothetical protein
VSFFTLKLFLQIKMNRLNNWLGFNVSATPTTEDTPKITSTPISSANTSLPSTDSTPRTSVNQNQPNTLFDTTTTTSAIQQQPIHIPVNVPQPVSSRSQQSDAAELSKAVDRVNETKSLYDNCEARRMTAVINGKDAQDYSCEREFFAFKKAFDIQLALESKLPTSSQ